MRNEYLAFTSIMKFRWAGLKNKSPREVVGNKELVKLIEYTLRFHLVAELGQSHQAKLHGTLSVQYGIEFRNHRCINEELDGLIGACVLSVNMLNACQASTSNKYPNTTEYIKGKVSEAAKLFIGAFRTMESSAGQPKMTSTILYLGESYNLD